MRKQEDYGKYVDVFYGNGEVDHFAQEGLASKWFSVKALCGNTTPHAVYPFGRMSVGAYSGGYPSGYGTHYPNSCGGIKKLSDQLKIRGFSHLHQTGTGGIGYYYNYAITTPFYGSMDTILEYHEVDQEMGRPGYYSVVYRDVRCELTVNENVALHRYRFGRDKGRIAIDFSNDGLSKLFSDRFHSQVKEAKVELASDGEVLFCGVLSGVRLYFCALVEGSDVRSSLFVDNKEIGTTAITIEDATKPFGAVFDPGGKEAIVKVAFSTIGYEQAREQVRRAAGSLEEMAERTYEVWNSHLSAMEITTTDEELKRKFYSNLYHSLIKPCDMTGEEILGIKGDLVVDFATLWDQYKTLLPMIFLIYPDMGEKIVKAIVNVSRTLGRIPCGLGLTDKFTCEAQAKMLGILALCDACHCGLAAADQETISECMKRELLRDDMKSFLEKGTFERYTHILDTTEACLAVAQITEDKQLEKTLLKLAENWVNAYDEDGLMSANSSYYEGDRYTYSFRLQNNMDERIALAGGKQEFVRLLDDFFGFKGDSIKPVTQPGAWEEIEKIQQKYHRFEGFNNECDMEAPYAYIYAGRHDRTCEIVHESIHKSFTLGRGALPGNNDSGGLSSCFVWNVLGIFPASGTGEFLLGCPHVDRAVLKLGNGRELKIEVRRKENTWNPVKSVEFNGRRIHDFRIRTEEVRNGGELIFDTYF